MTSNIGGPDIAAAGGELNDETRAIVMNQLKNHFRPEFLNRIDEIIMFKSLDEDNIGHIVDLMMKDLNKRLADKEITISLTPAAKALITRNGYDPVYGARPLKRYLQKNVETLVARLILSSAVSTEENVVIDVENDTLVARYEKK
jgi:ATP-dependent Clp protease ATP-binding subunit ClpB